jgi:predicted glycoside hydrolase/deacetylase ChbG (UPF0249 family)
VTRRLIVTADDFGDTPAVNAAVVRACREGVLRFASLMVLRPAAAEAARLAAETPGLGVGLHLELCADAPGMAGLRYFFDPRARAGLEGEIRAQFDALLALGVKPTHADGHINVHAHPVVFPALCRVAREYGVPRVRLPGGEWAAHRAAGGSGGAALAATFAAMGAWVGGAGGGGVRVTRAWGLLRSGLMTEEYAVRLVESLPEGETELYFHPTVDASLRPAGGRPTPSHQSAVELEVLLSPRLKDAIARSGVELVSA